MPAQLKTNKTNFDQLGLNHTDYSNTDSNFQCNFVPFFFETPANLEGEWKVESKFSKKFGNLKGIGFTSPNVPL